MTIFTNVAYPTQHPGVARAESPIRAVRPPRGGFDSTKGLAYMLLAAVVAALLVVANQVVDTWTDGHLLAAWIVLWAIGFAALALFATTARKLAARAVSGLDAWSERVARVRADTRFIEAARQDPRIMAELQAALGRAGDEAAAAKLAAAVQPAKEPHVGWFSQYESMFDFPRRF